MDFNPSKRNHKSPSVYSQRDVTPCCVSTRSVVEMRALPSRCVPIGATRPPDLLVRVSQRRSASFAPPHFTAHHRKVRRLVGPAARRPVLP